jgi:gluconokinase
MYRRSAVRAHYPRVLAYPANVVIIVMGVAGAGKTTVGRALAAQLGCRFVEGDDHHSPAAVEKMRAGTPLTDADRAPWLIALHRIIATSLERRETTVLTCSALKERYRQTLRGDCRTVRFVHLHASEQALARRIAARGAHFFGPSLLPDQLATLEAPTDALTIDGTQPVEQIVATIRREFGL